jgi:hypothetical protein
MLRDIGEIQTLATKYSKPQLARMAQMGLIDPTKAVMAGMMIDRITKSNMQAPQQTVAEEALTPAAPPPPMQQAQPPVAPAGIGSLPTQPEPNAGVAALPSGITEMAGGGIVAFDDGGEVPGYAGKEESVVRTKYGRDFDFLPIYVPPKTESPPAPPLASDAGEVFSNIGTSVYNLGRAAIDPVSDFFAQPTSRGSALRVDPNTGKPVSFGEYMRLQEAERNAAALPAATAIVENVAGNRPPLADKPPPAPEAPRPDTRARPGARQGSGTRQGPAAPSAEQPSGMQSLLANRVPELKLDPNVGKFETKAYKMPEKKELKDYLRQQEEADRAAGVNTNIYKDLMGDLETKKGKLANRKQEAIGAALMQTGLGLLGARKGQEFAVLGEAGQRSLQGLVAANERIRETEEKIDDARRGLLVAENDYKRTRSDKALDKVERNTERIENLEIKNVDNINTANQERAKIGVLTQGQGIELQRNRITEEGNIRTAAINLETERMRNRQSEINTRISAAAQNRPGESERLMSQYENIQKTQGQEAANAWLSNLERVRGAGKPQNTFSYEEAMKIVAAKGTNINASPQELARQAKELVAASNPAAQPANVPPVGTIQEWDGKKWKFKGGANTKDNWEQVK